MQLQLVVFDPAFHKCSSVLNRSHVATIWNFDPYYSLPNVTQDSLPKMFQIVAMWLQFSTEEYTKKCHRIFCLKTFIPVQYVYCAMPICNLCYVCLFMSKTEKNEEKSSYNYYRSFVKL